MNNSLFCRRMLRRCFEIIRGRGIKIEFLSRGSGLTGPHVRILFRGRIMTVSRLGLEFLLRVLWDLFIIG